MPDPTQTPASRRFVQPSNASTGHSHGPPLAPPSTSSSSRRRQFTRPSQPSSSSPFARTPFSKQARDKDDIETSFEEGTDSLSGIPPSSTGLPNATQIQRREISRDYIEDDSDNRLLFSSSAVSRPGNRSNLHPGHGQDTPPRSDSPIASPGRIFSSPLPKRQKTSHNPIKSHNTIEISSSPSPPGSGNEIGFSDSEPEDVTTTISRHDQEEPTRPKFLFTSTSTSALREPGPSSTSRSTTTSKPLSRNVFLGLPTGSDSSTFSHQPPPLPSTFSPSHRKGKNEYIDNGAASTVRRWILDLAGEQSRAPSTGTGTGTKETEQANTIHVRTLHHDESDRFMIVKEVETGETWMLVGQDERLRNSHESGGRNRTGGGDEVRSVVIKNRPSTTWQIPWSSASASTSTISPSEVENRAGFEAGGSDGFLNVAVLWEVKK